MDEGGASVKRACDAPLPLIREGFVRAGEDAAAGCVLACDGRVLNRLVGVGRVGELLQHQLELHFGCGRGIRKCVSGRVLGVRS